MDMNLTVNSRVLCELQSLYKHPSRTKGLFEDTSKESLPSVLDENKMGLLQRRQRTLI